MKEWHPCINFFSVRMSPKKGLISTVDMKSIKEEPSEEPEDSPNVSNEQKGRSYVQEFTYHCPTNFIIPQLRLKIALMDIDREPT